MLIERAFIHSLIRKDPVPPLGDEPPAELKPDPAPTPPPDHKPPPSTHARAPKREPAVMTIASSGDDEPPRRMDLNVDDSFDDGFDADAFAAMDEIEHHALPSDRTAATDTKPSRAAIGTVRTAPDDVKPSREVVSGHFNQAGTGARAPLLQGGAGRFQGSSQDVKPKVGASRATGPGQGTARAVAAGKRKVEVLDLLDSTDED